MKKVSLEEIAGGALQEQFSKAFEKVIENLADPNTSFKEARKITITLKFTQNEKRDDVTCDLSVSEKLAAQVATRTTFGIAKNLKTGEVVAEEYGKQIVGQTTFDDIEVDQETGEVIKSQKAEVIDLRKAMCN